MEVAAGVVAETTNHEALSAERSLGVAAGPAATGAAGGPGTAVRPEEDEFTLGAEGSILSCEQHLLLQ